MVLPYFLYLKEMVIHAWETFQRWKMNSMALPPSSRPLLADYQLVYVNCSNTDVEEAARDFHTLELAQATFYALVMNNA